MAERHRILLLDDDQDLLQLYKELLAKLPSQPEIYTASSGARAIALLESEPFTLLISDLSMPKMDGLQVLSIVRRKFPHLRTAVLTCVADEQFRTRAYSIGVDIFLEKPGTPQEIGLFLDCIESLLGRQVHEGFRGLQSKSLVDIVQLECLSRSSSVLKVTNGILEGKIWFRDGEVVHAVAQDMTGEAALQRILAWKTGNFEIMPDEASQERTIFESCQGLLLKCAQAQDESLASTQQTAAGTPNSKSNPTSAINALSRFHGVEFVLSCVGLEAATCESWGVENQDQLAAWAKATFRQFHALGERLQAGRLHQIEGFGLQNHIVVAGQEDALLCVGFQRNLAPSQVRDTMKNILATWAS